jgi:ATP-dependent Clp protease protease subunit
MDQQAKQQQLLFKNDPIIELHIQSTGGALMPAFYITDLIKIIDTPIHTYVDGYCASAASLIAVAGDKRFMTNHSAILIHQLSAATSGKFQEIQAEVSNLALFMTQVRELYTQYTNIDKKTLELLLNTDKWLDSKTCLQFSLVDYII